MAKKPKYKLDVYLDDVRRRKKAVRERVVEAEEKVRAEREALEAIQAQLDRLTRDKEERTKEYWKGMKGGTFTVAEIQTRKNHLESIEGSYRDARRKYLGQDRAVGRAEKALAAVQEEYKEISNEVKVHEELKEKWLKKVKYEEMKREEKSIEEISSALYEKRRREGRNR